MDPSGTGMLRDIELRVEYKKKNETKGSWIYVGRNAMGSSYK